MNPALDIEVIWCLCIMMQLWIAYRIFRGQLGASFNNFALYLTLSALVSIFRFSLPFFTRNQNIYGYSFLIWTYAGTIFEFLIIRELTANAFAGFPAIRAASRMTLNVFWSILIVVGAAWFWHLNTLHTQKSIALLLSAIRYQEAAALGFTLFVFLLLAFLAWMPVPLSRNLLNHSFLIGAFFLVVTLSRFSVELGEFASQRQLADYIALGGQLVVLFVWDRRIRVMDDNGLRTPKGPLNPQQAEVLIGRLDELNEALVRSGPKVFR